MNRFIANAFAGILSIVHIVVIAGLGFMTIAALSEDRRNLAQIRNLFGVDERYVIGFVIAAWIGYVLLTGLLSTAVAINENLERLNEKLDQLPGKLRGE
jgi:hypothetical protein